MRRDDPEALGHMITNIQKKACECESQNEGQGDMPVRLRFMLEVLMAIRNNNVRKVPGVDLEAVDRMRRVAGACIRGQYLFSLVWASSWILGYIPSSMFYWCSNFILQWNLG